MKEYTVLVLDLELALEEITQEINWLENRLQEHKNSVINSFSNGSISEALKI